MAKKITLNSLKNNKKNIESTLLSYWNQRQTYVGEAEKVQAVYDRMYNDKKVIEGYRRDLKAFYKENYDMFKGDVFKNRYKKQLESILNEYDGVIDRIDVNLDSLNNKVAEYRNQAYSMDGPIGRLEKSLNKIKTQIENWAN